MTIEIARIGDSVDRLGEGPLWDADEQALYWVDSTGCAIHRLDWQTRERSDWPVPGAIGSMALRTGGGALIALESGFHLFDFHTGEARPIGDPEANDPRTRFNDGKVDRQGRFLCGSMGREIRNEGLGSLYRVDADLSIHKLMDDIAVSNGPCFSPDGATFYFADSPRRVIHAFDYDQDTGGIANRRTFADLAPLDTAPDGATVDAEGNVWSALVRSGQIGRFSPDGKLQMRIDMPCALPSSVMFGGPDLDILIVTSIRDSGNRIVDGPADGGLFAVTGHGAKGLPEPRFAG
jgi:L-arabinonolactonase